MDYSNKQIIVITGPSGVGKTTLGNKLATLENISIPRHCTTRKRRNDDIEGFYRFLNHEQYKSLFDQKKFLISSGDGIIISKEYGNFYGVLKFDCENKLKYNDMIILFLSYKDIYQLIELQKQGLNISIINLRFADIELGMKSRLINDLLRNHTELDIQKRIQSALLDEKEYGSKLEEYAKTIIYTDKLEAEETYDEVCKCLKLKR